MSDFLVLIHPRLPGELFFEERCSEPSMASKRLSELLNFGVQLRSARGHVTQETRRCMDAPGNYATLYFAYSLAPQPTSPSAFAYLS